MHFISSLIIISTIALVYQNPPKVFHQTGARSRILSQYSARIESFHQITEKSGERLGLDSPGDSLSESTINYPYGPTFQQDYQNPFSMAPDMVKLSLTEEVILELSELFAQEHQDYQQKRAIRNYRKLYFYESAETQINNSAEGDQINVFVFALTTEKIIIIWVEAGPTDKFVVQEVNPNLDKTGTQTQLDLDEIDIKSMSPPHATHLSNEHYVLGWESSEEKIYARIYDNTNAPTGDAFRISAENKRDQDISMATLADGSFVVTWTRFDSRDFIMARIFDSSGTPVGDEIEVFDSNGDPSTNAKVAALNDGGFVVSWTSDTADNDTEVLYKVFDSSGSPTSESSSTANTYSDDEQDFSVVTCLNSGRFVIAYSSKKDGIVGGTIPEDTSQGGVYAQVFESSGTKVGDEFLVNTYTTGIQKPDGIAPLYDGGFIIIWGSQNQDGDGFGVYAQRFDSNADPVDGEFIVNDTTDENQNFPRTAASVDGFVVAWQSFLQDGFNHGIYAKSYRDEVISIDVNYPLEDVSIYKFQSFSYVIPANTFLSSSSSSEEMTYSVAVKLDGEYIDMSSPSTWLSFDDSSRTFSGTPDQEGSYEVEVTVSQSTSTGTDEFVINVLANTKPTLNSPIPDQLVPFNSEVIWELHIPVNTFTDLEGDTITYTDAFMVLNEEERSLNAIWESLTFDDGKLYGIPNLGGNYIVRIYADDGLGDLNPTAADINIEVFSQGLEILELYNINQAGSRGLISGNRDHFWVTDGKSVNKFDLDSNNPLFVSDAGIKYVFPDDISDLEEISDSEFLAVDRSGNIKLLSSLGSQEHGDLTVNESISDIYKEDENSFYVSHGHSISYITIIQENLQLDTTYTIDDLVNKITKIDNMIYAATENGLYQINTSLGTYDKIDILDQTYIYDIASHDTYLYALGGGNLIIINAEDPDGLWFTYEQVLLGSGTSFYLFEREENIMCMVIEEGSGVGILNLSNPEHLIYEGYYYPTETVNQILVDSTGNWGIALENYKFYTIEIFRKEVLIERCDTDSESDPCEDLNNVQANRSFSKDLKIAEQHPTYDQGYFYGYFYIFSATWYSDGSSSPLPSWVESTQEESDQFKVTGTVPDSLVGSVLYIEVIAHVYSTDSELVIILKDLVSLSVVPRESSLAYTIADQSLQVGDEWLFSFSADTFNDADEFECEYQINSEWIKSYDLSFILFIPEQRKWYMSSADSNKETLFQCDPCDSSEYSATYVIKVTGRNSESEYDQGVSTTFNLFLYSGRIPDQEIHPGLSQTIILDEDIFPTDDTYTVLLLNDDGEAEALPWWMSFISNERKILMFPSASEVGQDFSIQVSGLETDTELVSQFTIMVRNEAPVVIEALSNQRIKLGTLLDYSVPETAFSDPDSDALTYTVRRVLDDGSETSALPSWVNFNSNTQTFYGIPTSEETLSLLVYVDDGYGGETSQELVLECYNNVPQRNHAVLLDDQSIHIGDLFTYSLSSSLFIDDDDEDSLTYSASQSDGSSLPAWLSFNTYSLTFSGTPSDDELLDNPVYIQVSANDGYSSASTSFTLSITNVTPEVGYAISTQLSDEINQGFITLKPGIRIEFLLSSTTFVDGDNDDLSCSARLSDGNPLPEWLVFDSNTLMFYGTPSEVQSLSISVTASDGYSSVTTSFDLNIQNKVPTVGVSLQSQFESLYSVYLTDGTSVDFSFSSGTFQDEDDETLSYSVQFKEDNGEWRSLDYLWLDLDGRTLSGTATSSSINNSTITIQVTASDGFESAIDEFSIIVLSLFPETSQDMLYVESQRSSIKIEVSTNGPKISVFSYGSVSVLDTSNGQKTDWKLEGSPADINYVLERVNYRESSSRLLAENTVYLKIDSFEQEYPISVFSLQQPIISSSIPDQKTYIESSFSINVKKYFNYIDQDLLTYSFSLTTKPGGSKDWLSFDSRTLSGIPTDSTDTGVYIIEITAEDEFEESSSESFELEVNYTIFQFMVAYSLIMLELGGPLLTLLGIFAFRTNIVNYFFKASKKYAPLEIDTNELSIRQLFVLRKDEEKVANKIFKKLSNNCETDEDTLIYDLDRVLFERNDTPKYYKSVVYPEVYNFPQYNSQCTSFKGCLKNNDSSIIEIKKKKYHAKYLYLCIKDLIYKSSLIQDQIKELNALIAEFKKYMMNNYFQKMLRTYGNIPIDEWAKSKDAWTMLMPDLYDFSLSEYYDLGAFLEINKTNLRHDIILNCLKIEQWKDRAIRLNDLSELDKIKIYYEYDSCCKMRRKKVMKEWVYRKWLVVNLTEDALRIEFDDVARTQKEDIHVQTFDESGYLISETLLLSSRRSTTQIPFKENISRSRIDSVLKDQMDVKEVS